MKGLGHRNAEAPAEFLKVSDQLVLATHSSKYVGLANRKEPVTFANIRSGTARREQVT